MKKPLIPLEIRGLAAGITHLCSNHWDLPFNTDELRNLALPGDRGVELSAPSKYQIHALSKRLGAKKLKDIAQRYKAGESARALAMEHGVSTSALINLFHDYAIVVRQRGATDAAILRMAKDYEAGATVRDLVKQYELSQNTVLRALHGAGVTMRSKGRQKASV